MLTRMQPESTRIKRSFDCGANGIVRLPGVGEFASVPDRAIVIVMLHCIAMALLHSTAAMVLAPAIVVVPIVGDGAQNVALSHALDGALFVAATARGLKPARLDAVRSIGRAVRACDTELCRVRAASRTGAHFVLTAQAQGNELRVFVLTDDGTRVSGIGIAGSDRALLAQVPQTVDALLETIAPQKQHARAQLVLRAQAARSAGDIDGADALFGQAIAIGPVDDTAASLMLSRIAMLHGTTRGLLLREELEGTFGPEAPLRTRLSDDMQGFVARSLLADAAH